jgi:hypothetical protein
LLKLTRLYSIFAADTAASTAVELMHRERLMIGEFPALPDGEQMMPWLDL